MQLYPFQEKAHNFLRRGKPVILHAPTGAGKTRAALYPFLWTWEHDEVFPRQCLYSVPMRVLASQFFAEFHGRNRNFGFKHPLSVTLQTGEHPEDPELGGDLIFTTIDQTLSNLLGVPYSVSASRANLNAGAVIGSYLVFDEFHLFPVGDPRKADGALVTTLQLLRALNGLVPFTLMTATFSRTLLDELCDLLAAEKVSVSLEDLAKLPSQTGKERRFFVIKTPLSGQAVLERSDRRTIGICNTVERAVTLYQELINLGCQPVPFSNNQTLEDVYVHMQRRPGWEASTWVMLLHSRFEQRHRGLKEKLVLAEFGNNARIPRLILVATQVVEVGLDITSQTLHTEIAPANAILQRAGRCARFAGEQGEVYVYDVPSAKNERFRYAPYLDVDAQLCRRAWEAFCQRSGSRLDFLGEQAVVDEVHRDADQMLLEAMRDREGEIWKQIFKALGLRDIAQRQNLIRRVQSRIVLIHDAPETLLNPYRCPGFSLWQGTLRAKWKELEAWRNEKGLPWALQYPVEVDTPEKFRQETSYRWHPVDDQSDLNGHAVFVVHPALAFYDSEVGLRFAQSDGTYRSVSVQPEPVSRLDFKYHLEDYRQHICRMEQVYRKELAHRLAYISPQLERRLQAPRGSLERAVLLAITLHDVGKMDEIWQRWARAYQAAIGETVKDDNVMIVHTHLETAEHRKTERHLRAHRPPHAGEGALASVLLLNQALGGHGTLRRATVSAIARHHSASASSFEPFQLHPAAVQTVAVVLEAVGWSAKESSELASKLCPKPLPANLERHLLRLPPEDTLDAWFAYFIIARNLRLADGRSQAI